MPRKETKNRGGKVLAVTVLALLVLLSVVNFGIVRAPLSKFVRKEIGFEELVDEVQKGYVSNNFFRKNDFLNLNGAFARLTGRRVLNTIVRLNNGTLSSAEPKRDMTSLVNGLTGFSDYLNERDIPFLYVQMPSKESLDGQSFPVGVESYGNENADKLLSLLSAENVETLDMRPLVSQTQEMVEQYFYWTDHHWNGDGAFVGFQELISYLHERFPEGNIDLTYAQADQWERHEIDDWFLGSHGIRVGTYFGGTDSFIWYTPKFETEISCAIPDRSQFYRGDFTAANIRSKYINEKLFFDDLAYRAYLGGDFPLMYHRNLNAPSPLKVLVIKDSYILPVQSMLSTVFQEIDMIDPRYFSECTIAEYVERTEPDIVIYAIFPGVFGMEAFWNFGVEDVISVCTEDDAWERVTRQNIAVEADDRNNNYAVYPLEGGNVYRVSFGNVDVLKGQTEGAGLRVYNKTTNAVLESTIFDITYCEATDGFRWTFSTPDAQNEFQLLFYAGMDGSTKGNWVVYRNMVLERMRDDEK